MKNIFLSGLIAFSFFVSSCSTKNEKKPLARIPNTSASPSLAEKVVEAKKQKADLSVENKVVGNPKHPFFSKIQILSESLKGSACMEEQRMLEDIQEEELAMVDEANRLVLTGVRAKPTSVYNLRLRVIGFDEVRFRLSLVDGKTGFPLPYGLKLDVLATEHLQVRFLDKVIEFNPKITPVFSFQAVENRGDCEITHNVNIFAENAGRYPELVMR